MPKPTEFLDIGNFQINYVVKVIANWNDGKIRAYAYCEKCIDKLRYNYLDGVQAVDEQSYFACSQSSNIFHCVGLATNPSAD